MATPILTGTEPAPALDRSGHPCPIAYALRRFNEHGIPAIDDARALDTYRLVHTLARGMDELINRLETIGQTLEMLPELMGPDTDNDKARAVVEMAEPYRIETANLAFELCGQALAALERGNLLAAVSNGSQKGVQHA